MHSSTLVTAGIFLIIRLRYWIPLSPEGRRVLLFCGSVTCLLGGWAATYENDLKKIIALSTLRQLGVIVFSLGLGLPCLSLFHLYTHALFKALLFIAAGHVLISSFGSQDIRLLGGLGRLLPYTGVIFGVRRFCLIGAPFLRAFYSKHMILEKILIESRRVFGVTLMMVATFFTAKYVSRRLKCILWRKPNPSVLLKSSNLRVLLPIGLLGVGAVVGGKFIYLLDLINLESAYISNMLGKLINIVTVLGVLVGIFSTVGFKKSWFLSRIFFLTPMVRTRTLSISPLISASINLDRGWLEPRCVLNGAVFSSSVGVSSYFL